MESYRPTLSLQASAVAALRAHPDRQAWERKAAGARWCELGMVFTTSMGTSGDHDRLTKKFAALLSRTGLREPRFDDLLHTTAALMLRDGLPVHEVSGVFGHSQATATLSVYAHVLPGANERTAATVEPLS